MKEKIKRMSIRSRMAFATTCVEILLKKENVKGALIDHILRNLWKFTSEENLEDWDKASREYSPYFILGDPIQNADELSYISMFRYNNLKKLYASMPKYMVNLINEAFLLGASNIYAETGEYSSYTLKHTNNVIQILKKKKFDIPELESFLRSTFDELDGWGEPHQKEFYKIPYLTSLAS